MKRIPYLAALVVAGAASMAAAQTDPAATSNTLSNANTPTARPDISSDAAVRAGRNPHAVPAMQFVPEPTASSSKTQGPDAERAKAIVDALNADASLKDSKITVQPTEDDTITLSGATMTRAQAKRAGEIAAAQAGEGKVINAIRDSEA